MDHPLATSRRKYKTRNMTMNGPCLCVTLSFSCLGGEASLATKEAQMHQGSQNLLAKTTLDNI